MFGISTSELAVIIVVALLVLGPKRLPEAARFLGKIARQLKSATDELRGVMDEETDVYSQAKDAFDFAVKSVDEQIEDAVKPEPAEEKDTGTGSNEPSGKDEEDGKS